MTLPVIETKTNADTSGVGRVNELTLTKPAGVQSGDLLLILITNEAVNGVSPDFDALATFTILDRDGDGVSDTSYAAYWRIADGTEAATIEVTYTGGISNNAANAAGWYIRISGVDQTTPINVVGTALINGASATHAITGVTTDVDDCLAFYLIACDGGDTAPVAVSGAGWTEEEEINSGVQAGDDVVAAFGTKDQVSFGATGTATVTPTVTDSAAGIQFAIAPDTVVATPPAMPIPLFAHAMRRSTLLRM